MHAKDRAAAILRSSYKLMCLIPGQMLSLLNVNKKLHKIWSQIRIPVEENLDTIGSGFTNDIEDI